MKILQHALLNLAPVILAIASSPDVRAEADLYELNPPDAGAELAGDIQSPVEFLGFRIGERMVSHDEVLRYFRYLASATDRAQFAVYGTTHEGRELFRLAISEPTRLQDLDAITTALSRAADDDSDAAFEALPAIAWMGYGIHGNELASSDAAVMVAYRLVAGESEEIETMRRNLIVYVDPMFNPEGRARAMAHVAAFRRSQPSVDPQDIVHREFWDHGRGNHYFIDLNRDALFQVQDQSRQRVKAILDAEPQLVVDAHETGSDDTYMFAVPAEPLNPFIPPQVHESWADLARDQSSAFDRRGLNYYTREWGEAFYAGYFDSLPAFYGAVPMLYEQAATSGLAVETPTEQILTFESAVSNHYRSSMANLLTAARSKDILLTRWRDARRDARDAEGRTWFILPDDAYKLRETRRVLESLRIEFDELAESVRVRGLASYWADMPEEIELPAGTLRVAGNQRFGRIVHNLLDYHVPMSPDFLAREKRNLDLGHDTQLYDVTSWSLPLAFNAKVYWTDGGVRGDWGPPVSTEAAPPRTPVQPANYGYLYVDDSLHATARLIEEGVKVRVAEQPFVHESVSYPQGTFLVRVGEQEADALAALNREHLAGAIRLVPAASARIVQGGPDLGGNDFRLLKRTRIGIFAGGAVYGTSFGAIWHLLDAEAAVPVTLLNISELDDLDLSEYDVLVLPDCDAEDKALVRALKGEAFAAWLQGGGTLVATGGASLALSSAKLLAAKARQNVLEDYPPPMLGRTALDMMSNDFHGGAGTKSSDLQIVRPVVGESARAFERDDARFFELPEDGAESFEDWSEDLEIPDEDKRGLLANLGKYLPHGAYLRVDLKPDHWLAYGVGDRVAALFRESDVLIATTEAELVGRYSSAKDLMLSGLVWPEAIGYIAGTAYALREQHERGQVIAFANDPMFRGYSLGTARLFINAVFLGPAYR